MDRPEADDLNLTTEPAPRPTTVTVLPHLSDTYQHWISGEGTITRQPFTPQQRELIGRTYLNHFYGVTPEQLDSETLTIDLNKVHRHCNEYDFARVMPDRTPQLVATLSQYTRNVKATSHEIAVGYATEMFRAGHGPDPTQLSPAQWDDAGEPHIEQALKHMNSDNYGKTTPTSLGRRAARTALQPAS